MDPSLAESPTAPPSPTNAYHHAMGLLLDHIAASGKDSIDRMDDVLLARLKEYTVGVRVYFARRDAHAIADQWARAKRLELHSLKKPLPEESSGMAEINRAVREQVNAAGTEERDAVFSQLDSAGNSQVVAESSAAWHEMDAVLRGE